MLAGDKILRGAIPVYLIMLSLEIAAEGVFPGRLDYLKLLLLPPVFAPNGRLPKLNKSIGAWRIWSPARGNMVVRTQPDSGGPPFYLIFGRT